MYLNSSATNQFLLVLSASLLIASFGTSCGWPSFSFLVLESEDTPLKSGPLTTEELSWIVSIFCFGGVAGNFSFGWLVGKLGRKQILYILSIPQILSWILIILAQNATFLYASRLLVGIVGGGIYVIVPVIIAEVTEDRVRGMLTSILSLACNAGILLAFVVGHFFDYTIVAQILLILPIVYVLLVAPFPETPSYLMSIDRTEDAEKAFKFYRNIKRKSQITDTFRNEFNELKQKFSEKNEKSVAASSLAWRDFAPRASQRALFVAIMIIVINECSGAFILLSYTATIFANSGSVLSPNLSAIIVGVIQLAGTYISTIYIEKTGRKFLLIVSSVGTGIGNLLLGAYMYLNSVWECDLTSMAWIPIVSFSMIVLLASIGLMPISFVYVTEVMPEKIRSIGIGISLAMSWVIDFVILKYFATISAVIGMHSCILFFALSSFMGTFFVIYAMPETMGRSFKEIQKKLEW
ncbi:facilitated trehalose transporter Tret1-like [Bradysia coprophila]|uniref:facilitated trehalose transporter Tret1-like n=1 Tax=Bradysia coprophila TaxID=38358 RepID=UPI00187D944C|nr:facilitated trehalose transporter Tret1-like [Bradysia coprophila]